MALDWSCDALAEGLRCYESQEFFLAHEHWESIWLASEQPDKTFLQALIQTSAAFHHLQRMNLAGTASLLRAALRRLDAYPEMYGGVDVAKLRESICVWLNSLSQPDSVPDLPFPKIR